jgi:hypothetical protein
MRRLILRKICFILGLSLLALVTLAACGDLTATITSNQSGAAAGATVTPTVGKPVSVSPTVPFSPATTTALAAATTSPAVPAATKTPTITTQSAVATTVVPAHTAPVVKLSDTVVPVGGQVTLSGSGFSANTRLKIEGGYQATDLTLATLLTDEKGQFSKIIKFDKTPQGKDYVPGPFTFVITTAANGTGTKAVVTLQEPSKVSLTASRSTVKFGEELEISGVNFPANTRVKLMGGIQNPVLDHGTATTDKQGKFSIKTQVLMPDGTVYPEPYHFVAVLGEAQFVGMVSVTVTDGSENNLYLVVRVLENQGPAAKLVSVEEVSGKGPVYLVDFTNRPELTLADGTKATFESLKPGNIMELRGAEVPSNQRGDVPVIKPLTVRVTQ